MNFVKEGSYRSKNEEENQMTDLSSQNKIKNGNTFNGYFFLVIALAIKQWIARN
jgi:hypothetical protein